MSLNNLYRARVASPRSNSFYNGVSAPFPSVRATLFILSVSLLLLRAQNANATEAGIETNASRDNLSIDRLRTDLMLVAPDSEHGAGVFRVHGVYAGANNVAGIPGGSRIFGGFLAGATLPVSELKLGLRGGLDDATKAHSARIEVDVDYRLDPLRFELRCKSGWLDNWLAYGVRDTGATLEGKLDTERNWAALGAGVHQRSGGLQPNAELTLELPDNRLLNAFGWWSHAFTPWIFAGASVEWKDSQHDLHQPSRIVDGRLRYVDYPYPTPHQEIAFGLLFELRAGPAKLKANFPAFSDGGYRVEDPYQTQQVFYYRAHGMALATVEASVGVPLSNSWALELAGHAYSRPYTSYRWFSSEAWNEFGLTLKAYFKAPKEGAR